MFLHPLPDTQGGSAEIHLKIGNVIKLTIDEKYRDCGDENMVYVDYKNIVNVLDLGDIVFVDDGLISLKVTEKGPTHLTTGEGKEGRGMEGRWGEEEKGKVEGERREMERSWLPLPPHIVTAN